MTTISQNAVEQLIPGIRKNIARLVKDAYGKKPFDDPRDLDGVAQDLLPESSRNCSACADIENKRLVSHNDRDLKTTRQKNAERKPKSNEPKMHSLSSQKRKEEHAELRIGDYAAARYAQELGSDDEYDAAKAVKSIDYVGIFQPCCVMCAVCFAVAGLAKKTRGYHTKQITKWEWPPFIKADTAKLLEILGKDAVETIGSNEKSLEAVLQAVVTRAGQSNWSDVF
ncbi:MAG: hypothetical protein E6J91_37470 [Deltaproteobacteria bacterium]|nr:MAG: hypothetical protein E6J91_37470 [Deltaproteobacteria bacterium]